MRNVMRNGRPQSLVDNADEWKRLVQEAKNNGVGVASSLIDKYRQDDVRDTLRAMYSDDEGSYCCYCECQIDDVAYDHIEHRKPKSIFPECAFDWDNLHLACPKCNIVKSDKWDDENEILDAVVDKIKEHLGYELGPRGLYRQTITKRGITTVEHADLDRKSLLKKRAAVCQMVVAKIDEIKALGNDPKAYTKIKMLRDQCSGECGSLIEWCLDTRMSMS